MTAFEYVKPASLEQLISGLLKAGRSGAVLAGGTDVLVKIRAGKMEPRVLFDASGVPNLRGLHDEGERLRIGAAVTMAELASSPLVRAKVPALAEAAAQVGARQIRNRATVGGNIVTASPAADSVPPLLASGAALILAGPDGRRELSLAEFLTGPGQVLLAPGEVLVDVVVPADRPGIRSRFLKVGRRRAMAISVISLAGRLEMTGGIMREARILLGAVAPTAIRAFHAEDALRGRRPSAALLAEAARLAAEEARPITDVRATADGRRRLVEAWALHLLQSLVDGERRCV